MANINISFNTVASGQGGTPDGYKIYRADGTTTPSYNAGDTALAAAWVELTTGTNIAPTHAGFDQSVASVDTSAVAASTYTYAVLAHNAAGLGLPTLASSVPYASATA